MIADENTHITSKSSPANLSLKELKNRETRKPFSPLHNRQGVQSKLSRPQTCSKRSVKPQSKVTNDSQESFPFADIRANLKASPKISKGSLRKVLKLAMDDAVVEDLVAEKMFVDVCDCMVTNISSVDHQMLAAASIGMMACGSESAAAMLQSKAHQVVCQALTKHADNCDLVMECVKAITMLCYQSRARDAYRSCILPVVTVLNKFSENQELCAECVECLCVLLTDTAVAQTPFKTKPYSSEIESVDGHVAIMEAMKLHSEAENPDLHENGEKALLIMGWTTSRQVHATGNPTCRFKPTKQPNSESIFPDISE